MIDKEEIKISVIIPVYNVKQYIVECLDSLEKQLFRDFEIICVDDCSDDGTYEVLSGYAEKLSNLSVFRNVQNSGAALSRNSGLQYAKGKYVIFLDSDDKFDEKLLKNLYDACVKENAQVAFCLYSSFDEYGNIESELCWQEELLEDRGVVEEGKKKDLLFKYPVFPPYNKLVLKELLIEEKILFQDIRNANDVLYSLLVMTCAKRIVLLNQYLVYYRMDRKGNLSESRDKKKTYVIMAYEAYIKELMKRGLWEDLYAKRIFGIILRMSYNLAVESGENVRKGMVEDFRRGICPLTDMYIENGMIQLSVWSKYQYDYMRGKNTEEVNNKYYFMRRDIDSYFAQKKEKIIALWGAGKLGRLFLEATQGKNIEYVIDNDGAKQGKSICGKEIVGFEEIEDCIDEVIVLNPRFVGRIRKQVAGKCVVIDFDEVLDVMGYYTKD